MATFEMKMKASHIEPMYTTSLDNGSSVKILIAVLGSKANSSKIHVLVDDDNGRYAWRSLYAITRTPASCYTSVQYAVEDRIQQGWKVYHCGSTRDLTKLLLQLKPCDGITVDE
jgi:hypothetical protein